MKTYLFIDGTNLYAGQYELFGSGKYLDFPTFIKETEKKLKIKFNKIYFYASYTPKKNKITQKEKRYIINEFEFYKSVKNIPNLIFFKGYRSKTSGKEKEVDVKLAVDIVGHGLLNNYEKVYILSGDADFLQAAFFIRKYKPNIKISLLCLSNKIMFKGLYALPSTIIDLQKNRVVKNKNIIKRNKFIFLDENLIVKEIKK